MLFNMLPKSSYEVSASGSCIIPQSVLDTASLFVFRRPIADGAKRAGISHFKTFWPNDPSVSEREASERASDRGGHRLCQSRVHFALDGAVDWSSFGRRHRAMKYHAPSSTF